MAGFRRGRNSLDNIIDLTTSIEKQKKSGRITTAVFLDIKGAFDSVSHKAIRNALCYAGIGGRLYAWILDYLENRTVHMVTTEGKTAEYIVARGVPQGGVLSPTLFNITLIGLVNKLLEKSE